MKSDLVPIRIVFGRRDDGTAAYPNFNEIPENVRKGMKWSHYMDVYGIGMSFRDKVENLGTGGTQGRIVTMVPEDFANEAAQRFENVSIIDEEEFEAFYEQRFSVYEASELIDTDVLRGIQARLDLEERGVAAAPSEETRAERAKALDPNESDIPGIRKNVRKKWADMKRKLNVTVHRDHAKPE